MTTIVIFFLFGGLSGFFCLACYGLGRIHGANRAARELAGNRSDNVYDFATGKKRP